MQPEQFGALCKSKVEVLSDREAEEIGLAGKKLKPEMKKEVFTKTAHEMVNNLIPPRLSKTVPSEKRWVVVREFFRWLKNN